MKTLFVLLFTTAFFAANCQLSNKQYDTVYTMITYAKKSGRLIRSNGIAIYKETGRFYAQTTSSGDNSYIHAYADLRLYRTYSLYKVYVGKKEIPLDMVVKENVLWRTIPADNN